MKFCISRASCIFVVSCLLWAGFGSQAALAMNVAKFGDEGFLNIDYSAQLRMAQSDIGSGPAGEDSTTDIYFRRNRLGVLGALNDTFAFATQFEYNGGRRINDINVSSEPSDYKFEAIDYYLAITASNAFQVRAGKTKSVLTREVNEGCFDPLSMDRSVFINGPFKGKRTRDNGVVVWGNIYSDKFQYRLAAMQGNNFGDNKPDGIGYRYSGRVHYTFFDPEISLGYRGSYLGKKKVLTLGAGYETQAEAVYSNGTTGAEDYTAFTYDVFFEYPTDSGTYTLSGAYLKADFGGAGLHGVLDAQGVDGEKNGTYWKAAYMLGKTQVYARFEDWIFADYNGTKNENITSTTVGVNYYISGQNLRLTLEQTSNSFSKVPENDMKTITAQIQARF